VGVLTVCERHSGVQDASPGHSWPIRTERREDVEQASMIKGEPCE
jgi:hypothetical protein